jgi:hypothetical protein
MRIRLQRENGANVVYRVKWKQVPDQLDAPNNSPRRELASYALQKLLFSPERYVVVPTVMRCLPRKRMKNLKGASAFPGARCALGVVSQWLENAREFDDAWMDDAPPALASRIGDLNVFTIAAGHRDAIGANFLTVGKPPARVFVVDNGMAFGAWDLNPLGLVGAQWMRWRAQAVAADTKSRLGRLSRADLDVLKTVVQLELDPVTGMYRSTPPTAPWAASDEAPGIRRRGTSIQLGLTPEELDNVYERTRALLDDL